MLTGTILFFTTYFSALSALHGFFIMAAQVLIGGFLMVMLLNDKIPNPKNIRFAIRFETAPPFYICIFIVTLTIVKYCAQIYSDYPTFVPRAGVGSIDYEISFIASVRFGVNSPRNDALAFKDPLLLGQNFESNPIPFLVEAGYMALFANYPTASTLISLMNAISTTVAIYYMATNFSTSPMFVSLVYMFNGSWCLLNFVKGDESRNDLIHGFGRTAHTPWEQLIAVMLTFNKEFSFSIPMGIFALAFAQVEIKGRAKNSYFLVPLLGILCPNQVTSFAIFGTCSCYSDSCPYTVAFSIIPLMRILIGRLSYNPLCREYQMCGIYMSQIAIWWDSFGPAFFSFLLAPFFVRDRKIIHAFLASFASFLLLNIYRQGNDHSANTCAIMSVFFPMVATIFVECGERMKSIASGKQTRGVISGVISSIFVIYMVSGLLSIHRIAALKIHGMDQDDLDMGARIRSDVDKNEVILSDTFTLNPASAEAGRQIVSGSFREAWKRGGDVFEQVEMIRKVEKHESGVSIMQSKNIHYMLDYKEEPLIWDEDQTKFFESKHENEKWNLLALKG